VTNSLGVHFDFATYRSRGWCRLEMLARISQCDVDDMYVCRGEGGECVPMQTDGATFNEAIEVFNAQYTVGSDRLKLVDTTLGLYYLLLHREAAGDLSKELTAMLQRVRQRKAAVFPPEYFQDLLAITEDLVATGDSSFHRQSLRKSIRSAVNSARDSRSPRLRKSPTTQLQQAIQAAQESCRTSTTAALERRTKVRRTDGRETDGMVVRFRMMGSCASLGLKRAVSVVSGESSRSASGESFKRSPAVPRRLSPKGSTKKGWCTDGSLSAGRGQVEVRIEESNFA